VQIARLRIHRQVEITTFIDPSHTFATLRRYDLARSRF
jgi:hypothetical protein